MRDNMLYYGDNLDVLRHMPDDSVDLIYLDPPFNSNRAYNVLFQTPAGIDSSAQIQAFDDTWHWSQQAAEQLAHLRAGGAPAAVADAIAAMRAFVGTGDMLAYLVMMTPRLVELRRTLKKTGSIYLHCDPTASHYLKILMDAVFGPLNYRSEIIWKRSGAHNSAKRYGPVHDTILFYSKTDHYTWNSQFERDEAYIQQRYTYIEPDGRRFYPITLHALGTRNGESGRSWRGIDITAKGGHWKYGVTKLDDLDAEGLIYWPDKIGGMPRLKVYSDKAKGSALQDVWSEIAPLNSQAQERLGYPTQKPLALLERIIKASSNDGDIVLDPFCGCGTTIDAAEHLKRRWVGIDITYLAVDLISKRLRHSYGAAIAESYRTSGIPTDLEGAHALFNENPFDFERWAVSIIDAQPNEKQIGDRGIDGRVRFHVGKEQIGQIIVSVKGGQRLNPEMVRELVGTVTRERAEMGILMTLEKTTRGMVQEVAQSSTYTSPLTGQTYPKIQLVTVGELLDGKRPKMPPAILPYFKATQRAGEQLSILH